MNLDVLKKAGVDYEDGVRRFMGKSELYEELLMSFIEDETFASVANAYAAKNRSELLENAHELKGMSGNLSLTPLYRASSALVALLRGACSDEELSDVYTLAAREYAAIKEAILEAAR